MYLPSGHVMSPVARVTPCEAPPENHRAAGNSDGLDSVDTLQYALKQQWLLSLQVRMLRTYRCLEP